MTFKEFDSKLQKVFEELKIKRKANKSTIELDSINSFKIGEWTIDISKHSKEIRSGEFTSRMHGITIEEFTRIFNKFLNRIEPKDNTFYQIIYKPKGVGNLYNLIVIEVKEKLVKIITSVQHGKKNPKGYGKEASDIQVIIEENNIIVID